MALLIFTKNENMAGFIKFRMFTSSKKFKILEFSHHPFWTFGTLWIDSGPLCDGLGRPYVITSIVNNSLSNFFLWMSIKILTFYKYQLLSLVYFSQIWKPIVKRWRNCRYISDTSNCYYNMLGLWKMSKSLFYYHHTLMLFLSKWISSYIVLKFL